MGDTGPPYNLRFPELTDPPNVPLDMEELATDAHDAIASIDLASVLLFAIHNVDRSHLHTGFSGDGDGGVFTAPSTGKVLILFHHRLVTETSGAASVITRSLLANVQVRTGNIVGSGTAVNTLDTDRSAESGSKGDSAHGTANSVFSFLIIDTLTAGLEYNCEHVYTLNSTSNVVQADSIARQLLVLAVN